MTKQKWRKHRVARDQYGCSPLLSSIFVLSNRMAKSGVGLLSRISKICFTCYFFNFHKFILKLKVLFYINLNSILII